MEEKKYWVGFNHVKGIGAVRFQRLLEHFQTLQEAWKAPAMDLQRAGLGNKALSNLIAFRQNVDLDSLYETILQKGILVLTLQDEDYPTNLKLIDNAPPVLYIRGEITETDQHALAVVGTRKITAYGKSVVRDLSELLAQNKMTLVSGLARGVDSEGHRAILKAGGRTLAVLGSGVDVIYPPENAHLAREIMENGALISDYAPGTRPDGINFPPRNRIIAGLSLATVVIEAGIRSGALITATFTADQGKDVFAVPGSIYAPQSKGTNKLIEKGAFPLIQYDTLFEILDIENVQYQHKMKKELPQDETELLILQLLQDEDMHVDDIQVATGLPVERVSSLLVFLELKGYVRKTGTMTYSSIYEIIKENSNYA